MDKVKEEQLKIFNLFLMADGRIAAGEKEKLNAIYDAMKVEQREREKIEKDCEEVLYEALHVDGTDDNAEHIIRIIKKPYSFFHIGLDEKRSEQVNTIWNLINLGYSDNNYSVPEKKIVDALSEFWLIDKKVVEELEDSAETLVTLYSQREWIKTTNKSYDEIHRFIENIENDINQVSRNIELAIKEAQL